MAPLTFKRHRYLHIGCVCVVVSGNDLFVHGLGRTWVRQARFERHWTGIMDNLDEQVTADIDTSDLNIGPKSVKLSLSNPMFAALCLLHDWNRCVKSRYLLLPSLRGLNFWSLVLDVCSSRHGVALHPLADPVASASKEYGFSSIIGAARYRKLFNDVLEDYPPSHYAELRRVVLGIIIFSDGGLDIADRKRTA